MSKVSPSHQAIGFDSAHILKLLLEAGASLETTNARGHKPRAYVDESTTEGRLLLQVIDGIAQDLFLLMLTEWYQNKKQREKQERIQGTLLKLSIFLLVLY